MNNLHKKVFHFFKEVYIVTYDSEQYLIESFRYNLEYSETLEFVLKSLDYPTKEQMFKIETEIHIHNGYETGNFKSKGTTRFHINNIEVVMWDLNEFAEIYYIKNNTQ